MHFSRYWVEVMEWAKFNVSQKTKINRKARAKRLSLDINYD